MSSRAPAIRPRPIASICCSPPDNVPAFWSMRSRQARKQRQHAASILLRALRTQRRVALKPPKQEIFPHAHLREDEPAFGHLHEAALDALLGAGMARDVLALEQDASETDGRHDPRDDS